mgnify:CR=1 FL=1
MEFYSNCLVEALKAKIKNPKNVKLTYVRCKGDIIPHFLWSDGVNDYDFGMVKTNPKTVKWYNEIWFKGEIRKRHLGFNEEFKRIRLGR